MPVRNFSRLAVVFVVLFAVLVLGNLLPFQPLDPAWQSRLTAVLVNAGTLPLTGLALLQLAFLLRLQSSGSAEQLSRLDRAERQLANLRQALSKASSGADLSARFQTLSGPSMSPADRALPLPVLKAQAALALDQAQAQIERERNALPASDPLRLLPELLRSTAACLVLAAGFAIFAQRPKDELSLLEALRRRVSRRGQRAPGPLSGAQALRQQQEDYLLQLLDDDHKPG